MRKVFEISVLIIFTLASIYICGYLMFIGGITQMVESVKSDPMNIPELIFGLLKLIFCGLVGYVVFLVGMIASTSCRTVREK